MCLFPAQTSSDRGQKCAAVKMCSCAQCVPPNAECVCYTGSWHLFIIQVKRCTDGLFTRTSVDWPLKSFIASKVVRCVRIMFYIQVIISISSLICWGKAGKKWLWKDVSNCLLNSSALTITQAPTALKNQPLIVDNILDKHFLTANNKYINYAYLLCLRKLPSAHTFIFEGCKAQPQI